MIDQTADVQRYLDRRQANAATFLNDELLLRTDPRAVEVLEEYLHNVQRRIGLCDIMQPWELEIRVKEFMVRHRKMLGISETDCQWLIDWLDLARD